MKVGHFQAKFVAHFSFNYWGLWWRHLAVQVGKTKDHGLYNKPSAAVHVGALADGSLPRYNTIQCSLFYLFMWDKINTRWQFSAFVWFRRSTLLRQLTCMTTAGILLEKMYQIKDNLTANYSVFRYAPYRLHSSSSTSRLEVLKRRSSNSPAASQITSVDIKRFNRQTQASVYRS